jgi:uncharacterized membrane protein
MKPNSISQKKSITLAQEKFFSGPIPDAETLARYKEVEPSFPERILAMAELEQKNRHSQHDIIIRGELKVNNKDANGRIIGQFIALIAVIIVCCLSGFAIYKGFSTAGATIATSVIVALALAFLKVRSNPNNK